MYQFPEKSSTARSHFDFNMKPFKYSLLLWFLSPYVTDCSVDEDGYFMYADFWCSMHSREKEQVEYLIDWYFNKEFTMNYNSTIGNWTGLTPAGMITASAHNNNKGDLLQRKVERELICVENVELIYNVTEEYMAEPSISLQEVDVASGHNTMLVCSAYDFHPKYIKVSWHRDGQEVTEGVTESEVLTNGDWTYQVHSYLEYTPGQQDQISCMVEHATLSEPKILHWDSSLDPSTKSFLAGGVCALLFGAIFLCFGLIHYWKKSHHTHLTTVL
ncbi:rano class II histocompatibility antigen, A beta chain-like [Acanthochromis polyacanthus]|uniref:rano class II histocompatibility antigen, A beta chain-like n=1 Tax=Acanthochromis polyacanthus TaxID=80966 RepID=UPI00223439D4|nr:rano class II histocompatibility antigen, A beta chain-like [Acanthochromis polyacanthus]